MVNQCFLDVFPARTRHTNTQTPTHTYPATWLQFVLQKVNKLTTLEKSKLLLILISSVTNNRLLSQTFVTAYILKYLHFIIYVSLCIYMVNICCNFLKCKPYHISAYPLQFQFVMTHCSLANSILQSRSATFKN